MSVTAVDTIFIRNMTPGPAVHTHGDITIKWQGLNDPQGEDIQEVPSVVYHSAQFKRAVLRGFYLVVSEAEAETVFSRQNVVAAQFQAQVLSAIEDVIDTSEQDQTLVPQECLVTGKTVMIQSDLVGVIPPLAPEAAHMASMFAPTMVEVPGGQPITTWTKVAVAPQESAPHV